MPETERVSIRCWTVLNFDGRQRSGKKVGGYLPSNGDKWGHIRQLNLPTIDCFGAGLVFRGGLPIDGYRLCGIGWALISLAANAPIRGTLTHQPDEAIRPMTDSQLADVLNIGLADWKAASRCLTGVILAYQEIAFVVPREQARNYTPDRQLELFFGPDQSTTRTFPDSPRDARYETKQHDTTLHDTKRNEGLPIPTGPANASGDALHYEHDDDNENDNDAGKGERDIVALARATNERLLSYIRSGHAKQAAEHFDALLTLLLLRNRQPSDRDMQQWRRIFTAIYLAPGAVDAPAATDTRVDQFRKTVSKAFEMHIQPDLRNPAAAFAAWCQRSGWLPPAKAKAAR